MTIRAKTCQGKSEKKNKKYTFFSCTVSDFDDSNAGRQEGSIIIALAKSISWTLLLSISSVSQAINQQLMLQCGNTSTVGNAKLTHGINVKVQDMLCCLLGLRKLKDRNCLWETHLSLRVTFVPDLMSPFVGWRPPQDGHGKKILSTTYWCTDSSCTPIKIPPNFLKPDCWHDYVCICRDYFALWLAT